MGRLHSTLSRFNKSDFENGYTVNCLGLINQILRMGTLDSTLSRFNKSDYENEYTTQYTV